MPVLCAGFRSATSITERERSSSRKAAERKLTSDLGDRSTEIVEYVAKQTEPVTPKQVEDALGIPDARRYLARLADAGGLVKPKRGTYSGGPTVPVSQLEPLIAEWDTGTHGHRDENRLLRDCGQKLQLVLPGRTICEGCRMKRERES